MPQTVQAVVEGLPRGIAALDQPDLPGAGPLLHRLLTLDRAGDFLAGLDMDQARDAVSSCEAGADVLPVLPNAEGDVVCDANVKSPVLAECQDTSDGIRAGKTWFSTCSSLWSPH